jgi:diguanylate cyclase (GGDEF)-like protein
VEAAERLRETRRLPVAVEDVQVQVTASLGVSGGLPQPGERLEALLDLADQALYQAKRGGRNRAHAL